MRGGDLVEGGDAQDVALLGFGDETLVWNPGDDNDTIEDQSGTDRLRFDGSAAAEAIDPSADGERVRLFRNLASAVMDLDDVERIDHAALGGADTITVDDLTGTDVTAANTDLGGGDAGDGQSDRAIVMGTNATT